MKNYLYNDYTKVFNIFNEISEEEPVRIDDTISFYNSGFIFWDEIGLDFYGPFPTLFDCKATLKEYIETYLKERN